MRNLYDCYNSISEKITDATTDKFMLDELISLYFLESKISDEDCSRCTMVEAIRSISIRTGVALERLFLTLRNNVALDKKSYRDLFNLYANEYFRLTGSRDFLNLIDSIEEKGGRREIKKSVQGVNYAIRAYSN